MNPYRILMVAIAAGALAGGASGIARAQTGDWTDWAKSDVDGISYATRCVHVPGAKTAKDSLVVRFRNDGTTDFTGWWSVGYNSNDPTVTKRNESSHQKLALKPGAGILAPTFSVESLCLNGASINVGT